MYIMEEAPLFIVGLCTEVTSHSITFIDDDGVHWMLPLVTLHPLLRKHFDHLFLFRRIAYDRVHAEMWLTEPSILSATSYRLTWFPILEKYTITPVNGGGVPYRTQSCPPLSSR